MTSQPSHHRPPSFSAYFLLHRSIDAFEMLNIRDAILICPSRVDIRSANKRFPLPPRTYTVVTVSRCPRQLLLPLTISGSASY